MSEDPLNLLGRWDPSLSGDPAELALLASRVRRDGGRNWLPEPFCLEVGRRLLLAELESSHWTVRRVEKVEFERERSVFRQISIDFVVRDDAPIFVAHTNRKMYLVPLTMMRRRTLVNLALVDGAGRRIPMLGLRLAQQLDESILLAAAEASHPGLGDNTDLKAFVQQAVAGTAEEVDLALKSFRGEKAEQGEVMPVFPEELRNSDLFSALFHRLIRNFTFFVLLDADGDRHRVLTLSFDEPTDWRLQHPVVKTSDSPGILTYLPMEEVGLWPGLWLQVSTRLGWAATRIRFQTPGAENATSYHFEATAPRGVRIVEASLLAGRPNDPTHPVSVDKIVGHTPSVGLHAVEIPNVSLCRVELKLRVPVRGWLTTLVVACLTIVLVLGSVAWQWWGEPPNWSESQVTNVVLLLVTASASAATLIAQRDFGGLAAAMVSGLRAVGVCALALPIIAAGSLVFAGKSPWPGQGDVLGILLWSLTFLALLALLITMGAAGSSWRAERESAAASPWDMTLSPSERGLAPRVRSNVPSDTFEHAANELGFDQPAIGVDSAEGWYAYYGWTDQLQQQAVEALRHPTVGKQGPCGPGGGCATWASCPVHHSSNPDLAASQTPLDVRPISTSRTATSGG